MCYHKTITKPKEYLEERFKVPFEKPDLFTESYHVNGFSHSQLPIISNDKPEVISLFNWGLIPRWVKDKTQANEMRIRTLNAKSETVFDLPSFRSPIKTNRCLVMADGFFEWRDYKKAKYPYYITLKDNDAYAMAGIWESWIDKGTGEEVKTYSVLTCPANPLMAKIHNGKERMPVIIPKELEKNWLNNDLTKEEIQTFFLPYPEEEMKAHTISKLITSRTENSNVAKLLELVEYPELEQL